MIVSQNVDDLHQRAGNVDTIRLHGDILRDDWLRSCAKQPACDVMHAIDGTPPRCADCGNLVRPGVVVLRGTAADVLPALLAA